MNRLWVPLLLLIISCSSSDSTEWNKLTDRFFYYDKKGNYDSAKVFGELALQQAIEDFSTNDMRIAKSCNNLGEMYRELRVPGKALPLYMKAIQIAEFQNDTLNRIVFYSNLGHLHFGNDNYDSAKLAYNQAILLAENRRNQNFEDLTGLFSSLSLIEMDKENLPSARAYLKKATLYADNKVENSKMAGLYHDWGRLLLKESKPDSAFYYLTKSRIIKEKNYPSGHPTFANLFGLFGTYYHVKHEFDSAKKYYEAGLNLKQRSNGISPRDYLALKNLGRIYIDMGDTTKGKELQRRAAELAQVNKNYPQQ
jgi:tetratricopeptide (TPR) repeat protein